MKTRIVLLALGFPARNHLERGAQLAMRKYHKLLFGHLVLRSISVIRKYWKQRKMTIDHETFDARHTVDDVYTVEFAMMCRNVGIAPITVFCRKYYHSSVVSILRVRRFVAIIAGVDVYFSYSANERKAIFAHEIGHLLLPLDLLSHACDSVLVAHAKELAADAISTCVIGDARPLLFFFHRYEQEMDKEGERGKGKNLHPSHRERIDQLMRINAGRLNAR